MLSNRRLFLSSSLGLGVALASLQARAAPRPDIRGLIELRPNSPVDQTAALQSAIDASAEWGEPLILPPGRFNTGALTLRSGSHVSGAGALTTLVFTGSGAMITATDCPNVHLSNLTLNGGMRPLVAQPNAALVVLSKCPDLAISGLTISKSSGHAIAVSASSGRITGCTLSNLTEAAIFALDSTLAITANTISDCSNNGILVWRSKPAEDGTQVTGNRISQIRATRGGSGQYGNGVNVFRAGGVTVSGNTITDCAYSAVRGNAASNIAITNNHCQRIGEVALYAEFGFEGALIAGNIVDTAATGISVTNFNEGGRLAVIQGNLIRNLVRREFEPVDKRGDGIAVEADAAISGNTIENAANAGVLIGWGRYMRDVSATGNVIRSSRHHRLVRSVRRPRTRHGQLDLRFERRRDLRP
jgi:uncharacterized secreted repeat protein (TIGR03808 family)